MHFHPCAFGDFGKFGNAGTLPCADGKPGAINDGAAVPTAVGVLCHNRELRRLGIGDYGYVALADYTADGDFILELFHDDCY
jgi:hypothetical protein